MLKEGYCIATMKCPLAAYWPVCCACLSPERSAYLFVCELREVCGLLRLQGEEDHLHLQVKDLMDNRTAKLVGYLMRQLGQ